MRKRRDRELKCPREVVCRLQCVRQIDPRPLVTAEAIAGLVELEPDLEVRDGVGRHQQLVAVQTRQQVPWHILVPKRLDLPCAVAALATGALVVAEIGDPGYNVSGFTRQFVFAQSSSVQIDADVGCREAHQRR